MTTGVSVLISSPYVVEPFDLVIARTTGTRPG